MKIEPLPARGMRDILPQEMELRDHALAVILANFQKWGFTRVETPALDNIETLMGSQGGENEKLIFKILKRGEKLDLGGRVQETDLVDLGLRYDLTVPLARYYANNHSHLPKPFKAIQIGPVWRAERPQKGRFRQFTQCDIDTIGEASENAEIELILATCEALLALGFNGFKVRLSDRRLINGCLDKLGVRPELFNSIYIITDKLEKVGKQGVMTELASLGFSDQRIKDIFSFLESNSGSPAIKNVKEAVAKQSKGSYQIDFDPSLIRGMGYYTGMIFEIRDHQEAGLSIAGGGRYDKMVGNFLGQDIPACGFSIGFERIINLLVERKIFPGQPLKKIALLYESHHDFNDVLKTAQSLRAKGGSMVSIMAKRKNIRQQLDELLAQGFESWALLPENGKPLEFSVLKKPS